MVRNNILLIFALLSMVAMIVFSSCTDKQIQDPKQWIPGTWTVDGNPECTWTFQSTSSYYDEYPVNCNFFIDSLYWMGHYNLSDNTLHLTAFSSVGQGWCMRGDLNINFISERYMSLKGSLLVHKSSYMGSYNPEIDHYQSINYELVKR